MNIYPTLLTKRGKYLVFIILSFLILPTHLKSQCPNSGQLGQAQGFSLFTFSDFKSSGDQIWGRAAVGGNFIVSNYAVGAQGCLANDPNRIDLVVGGNLNFSGGEVNNGSVRYGGALINAPNIPNGNIAQGNLGVDFGVAENDLKNKSNTWAGIPSNGSVNNDGFGTFTLTGTSSTLNVFSISASDLQANAAITVNYNVPVGSTVLVNITGSLTNMPQTNVNYNGTLITTNTTLGNFQGAPQAFILWNLGSSTTGFTMNNVGFQGSILAPWADVSSSSGEMNGTFIAKSLTNPNNANTIQIHCTNFQGCITTNAPVCIKPTVNVTTNEGTCDGATLNNNASASASISGGDKADIVEGSSYGNGPAYNAGSNVTVSSGTALFFNLKHNTQYTIRVWNGANNCFEDKTFTTPNKTCVEPCNPPNPSGNGTTICVGNSTTISANGCDATFTLKWYSDAALTNEITTGLNGNSLTTPTLNNTTDYFAACVKNATCKSAALKITVTVNPKPTPSVDSKSICAGESATLTVSNCSGIVSWNTGASGSTLTISPNQTTTYTATCNVNGCEGQAQGTVTVNPKPTPSVDSKSICAGESATLTVSNCSGIVSWNTGASGSTLTISPNQTTTYTATCNVNGCEGQAQGTVTVNPKPTPSVDSKSICAGESATLTVSNCSGIVSWNTGASGSTLTISPNQTTTYTATCNVNGCEGQAQGTVTVNPKPTPSVDSKSICAGESATLTVSNCSGIVSWNTGASGSTLTISPNQTTTYTATCNVNGCEGQAQGTVTVNPKPTPSVDSKSICAGESATLTVSNCSGIVSWNTGASGSTLTISPNQTTTYTATCNVNGCEGQAQGTVTVNPKPTPSVDSKSICAGESATLTVSNCSGSVSWNTGASGSTLTISPNQTTTYTATCNVNGCEGQAQGTVTVNPKPTPSVDSKSICAGESATLTVSNCSGSVSWNTGASGSTLTVSPNQTTTYTATCNVNGCEGQAQGTVTVNPKPTPSVDSKSICAGESATLTVSNCSGSVSWNTGASGSTLTISPNQTTTYTATCNVNGCEGQAQGTVTVNPKPTPSVDSKSICAGESATLTVSNCSGSVSWNTGASGSTLTVSPNQTTTYTATCNVNGCEGQAQGTVTVNPKPTPSVDSKSICAGESATLTVSNCSGIVSWNTGASGATLTISPNQTTTYTATCSVNGCEGQAQGTVTVNPNPTLSITATDCAPNLSSYSVTFTTNGTVTSDKGVVSGNTVTGIPTGQTVTLTAELNGCKATATVSKDCNCPTIDAPLSGGDKSYCAGDSKPTLSVTVGSGLVAEWFDASSGGTKLATGTSFTPTAAGSYYVQSVNTTTNCKSAVRTEVKLIENPNPTLSITATDCAPNLSSYSVTFTTNGTVTSDKGVVSGNTVTGIPTGQTVTLTAELNGCKATATVSKDCNCPTIDAPLSGGDKSYCAGDSKPTLSVTVGSGLVAEWFDASSGGTKLATGTSFTPTAAGSYYVQSVNTTTNCKSAVRTEVKLIENPKPTPSVDSKAICAGESATLTVSNCSGSVSWNTGASGATLTISPNQTTTYTATCSVNGCEGQAQGTVTVNPDPTLSITATDCAPNLSSYSVTFTTNGTVTSDKGVVSGNTVTGIPTGQTVTLTAELNGCKATATVSKDCNCPTIDAPLIGGDKSYCAGDSKPTLSVTVGSGLVAEWFDASSGGTKLATGTSFTPTAAGSYYVQSVNTTTNCKSAVRTEVKLIENPNPTLSITATDCAPNLSSYSVTFTTNGTVTSDKGVVSGNTVTGIPTGQTVTLTAELNGCKATATVSKDCNCPTIDAPLSGGDKSYCAGDSKPTLSVTVGSGLVAEWFDASSGGTKLATGTSFTPTAAGSYYVQSVNTTTNCKSAVRTEVKLIENPKPSFILSSLPNCSSNNTSYSITVQVVGQLGKIKTSVGILTGSNPYIITGIPSGGSVKITDSLNVTCKFDTTIIGPNCNCLPKTPVLLAPNLTACIGDTFPTLKAIVVGQAVVEWFTSPTGGSTVFTGQSYKPLGTVPTTGAVFYAQARSTDPSCPTVVSPTRIAATINAQNCAIEIDLALKKMINTKKAKIGDELVYTIKVFNQGTTKATGVEVTDSIATTVQFVAGSFVASRGSATISGNVIKWTIGDINASPDTVTLTYKVKATQAGVHFNVAEISKTNEKDKDSTPGNGKDDEDDIDRQCFTVPFKLCPGEKLEASIPTKYTGVKWFKNGQEITALAGKNIVLFEEVGEYTFTATNNTCPASGCCPIIIEPGDNCCPEDLCVPFTIQKTKSRGKKL